MLAAYNLDRFVTAQEHVYNDVLSELGKGQKRTHWMWFIFPQIKGLGRSEMAQRYAISSVEETKDYMDHCILGERLIECCKLLLEIQGRSSVDIFDSIDALKLHSSMTLFARVTENPVFTSILTKYYAGQEDVATLTILNELRG